MKFLTLPAILVLSWLPFESALADSNTADAGGQVPVPAISIIIDDLGEKLATNLRALRMQEPLTYSILPHTTYGNYLALLAHDLGRETMMHLPMQSQKGLALGEGGLTENMNRRQFAVTFRDDLADLPHVSGVNNHMGSLLTQNPRDMRWLMEEMLQAGPLYFIDSRTTAKTIAYATAVNYTIPSMRRDVFLDNVVNRKAITRQFHHLLALARRDGTAIAIGHPNTATLDVLGRELPRLQAYGIKLLTVSQLIEYQKQIEASPQWHIVRSDSAADHSRLTANTSSLVTHNVVP